MNIPDVKEQSNYSINRVVIGATKAEGGTRDKAITVGGAEALPFLKGEGNAGSRPCIAIDVLDMVPDDWPQDLLEPWEGVLDDPGEWAKRAVEFGADMICVNLQGIHPDRLDLDAAHAVETVERIKEAVGVPLIVWRCEDEAKDNEVLPQVSAALKGERALFGSVTEKNYKRLTGVCLADGHNLINEAPIDVNIAKQINILISEMGFPLDRIVMYQTTGALGYGIEYVYSIHERQRTAALGGDGMMAMPVIALAGVESWRTKEAKLPESENPAWGPCRERAVMWEAMTALGIIQSGCDIVTMRHPEAVAIVKKNIDSLFAE